MCLWNIYWNHMVEFYPVSIRSIGIGCTSAISSLAVFFNEIILTSLREEGLSELKYFSLLAAGAALVFILTPETQNTQ